MPMHHMKQLRHLSAKSCSKLTVPRRIQDAMQDETRPTGAWQRYAQFELCKTSDCVYVTIYVPHIML